MPSGASKTPGRLTWPDRQKSFGPVFFGRPMDANQAEPRSAISVTLASVSTLLMMVGQPYRPTIAGNGGLRRGRPRFPSSDSRSAVSSPQM